MVRRLTLLLISTVLLMPVGASALGLGEIHLKSALNQAFDAKIDLLSVKPDELDGVKVMLASPEAFERSNVDRLFILTKLRYEPDLDENGKPVIHVTSRQAIREPFLNFLIEVNWAKGRLVREYTVLLDPPVTLDRKPSPVQTPAAPQAIRRPSPASSDTQRSQPPASQSEPAAAPYAGAEEYGPVMANESLWKIALETKPQGVTVEQMMMALQRKNPQAFIKDNVNNLKRGSILRMPTQEEIDYLSVLEAKTEFSSQVAEWKANRSVVPAGDVGGQPEETSDTKQPAADSKLKLASVRPEGEGKGGASEGDGTEEITSKLENELILTREQFESAKQERDDLSSQVSELESQLTDLESLLVVRNEQLARLQGELNQSEDDVTPAPAEEPMAEEAVADVESEAAQVDEIEISDETEEVEIAEPDEEAAESEIDEQETISEAAPAKSPDTPETAPEAAPSESILDTLKDQLGNNMIPVAGGGLVVLLLLLLFARRRKAESEEFEESILVGAQGEDTESLSSSGDDTEGAMSEAAETSFLSEFSHSDMDVLQDDTGEVDPIAEADVYIAYGRYQQAEELLRQAIDRDPDHIRSYFKLLEILFVTKNAEAFTEVAETLATKNPEQTDADAWQQALTMGHQLNSGHALFAGAGGEGVIEEGEQAVEIATETDVEEESEAEVGESDEDLDLLDLSELTADFDSGDDALSDQDGPISTLLEDDSLDFDLDLGLDGEEGESVAEESAGADDALLDADIGEISPESGSDDALMDLSTELPDSSVSELETEEESSDATESLSLDELDLGDPFDDDALEEDEGAQTEEAEEMLGGADDLAAALSSFTDEPVAAVSDSDDLAEALTSPEAEQQDESATAQDLGQALSEFNDDLSLDDALETDDLGAELADLSADLSLEEKDDAGLEGGLEGVSGLEEPLSVDGLMDEKLEELSLPDDNLESDELVLGDVEQEIGGLEDTGDQEDMLADVSLDDLELGELSESEGEELETLDSGDDLSDLSDDDLMIGDELSSELSMDEPMSELSEEPDKIDEINTKLDLARAYVEMGDEEGARSILDEVLNEGDEVQKSDAQELLGRLS